MILDGIKTENQARPNVASGFVYDLHDEEPSIKHGVLKILIADDDEGDTRQIIRALKKAGMHAHFTATATLDEALAACEAEAFDCAIVDYRLPGQDGLAVIAALHHRFRHMALVMSTGQGDERVATEAMKRGAHDYIRKSDLNPESILRAAENSVEKVTLHRRLVEQQEELQRFADVLVHDLRAPSSSIQTFAGYIKESIRDGQTDMIDQYCDWAIAACRRMDALVATLHQYTKAGAAVVFGPVDLRAVVAETLSNLSDTVQARGASVTCDALPNVTGNAPLLIQLLQNLLANAMKYCEAPAPRIHISASHDGDGWRVSISDNGIGIPAEHCEAVFEPFKRLHGPTQYDGTGLGLATCRKIVARHGGAIWCEPGETEGTTFRFTLPAPDTRGKARSRHGEGRRRK